MATIPISNPGIPFIGHIPGGLYHGRMIRIKGFFKVAGPHLRFNINLQCGPYVGDNLSDVALHMDFRPSENAIVRNSYDYNGWNQEERHGGCPIMPGQPYDILILAQNTCFKVAINGAHFCEFTHRMPMGRVTHIYIDRDTTVTYIGLEGDIHSQQQQQFQQVAPGIGMITPSAPPYAGGPIPPPNQFAPNYGAPPTAYNPNAALSYGNPHYQGTPSPGQGPGGPGYYGGSSTPGYPPYMMNQQFMP